jgi:hypothetical protein
MDGPHFAATGAQPATIGGHMAENDKSGFNLPILRDTEKEKQDTRGHTYVHFGGDLKDRFVALSKRAGYTRKLNDLGVLIFKQGLALAEAEYDRQTKQPAKAGK